MLSTLVLIGEAVVLLYQVENFVTLLNPHSSGTKFTTLMINSSSNSVPGVSQFKVYTFTANLHYRCNALENGAHDERLSRSIEIWQAQPIKAPTHPCSKHDSWL
jgi:hypothetical protein